VPAETEMPQPEACGRAAPTPPAEPQPSTPRATSLGQFASPTACATPGEFDQISVYRTLLRINASTGRLRRMDLKRLWLISMAIAGATVVVAASRSVSSVKCRRAAKGPLNTNGQTLRAAPVVSDTVSAFRTSGSEWPLSSWQVHAVDMPGLVEGAVLGSPSSGACA